MLDKMQDLIGARDLLYVWTSREFKARYAGSTLGLAWVVFYPLTLLLVLVLVFSSFLKMPTGGLPAPLFIYAGLAPWLFTNNTIQNSSFAVVANIDLVKNGVFPREILPLATVLVGCVDFAVSAVLLALLLVFYDISLGVTALMLPLIIAIQIVLTLAICLFLAAVVVLYRDVRYLIPIGLQFWMFLSPVFYSTELVPKWLLPYYLLNPMASLLDAYREVLLYARWPTWPSITVAAVISMLALTGSYLYFKKAEWDFADRN